MLCSHNRFNNKKELTVNIYNNMDNSHKLHVKERKADTKEDTQSDPMMKV